MPIKSVTKSAISNKIEKYNSMLIKKEVKLLLINYKKEVRLDHLDLEILPRLVQLLQRVFIM